MEEIKVPKKLVAENCKELLEEIYKEMKNKGPAAFVSTHEILGTIAEEYDELIHAVRANNNQAVREELLDLAVLAIFGISSMDVASNLMNKR
jgi:NTP pyrophosphatase (non-canonical NTP hydrolase)